MPILYLAFIISQRLALGSLMSNDVGSVALFVAVSAAFDYFIIRLSRMRTLVGGGYDFDGLVSSLAGALPMVIMGLAANALLGLEQGYKMTIVWAAVPSCLCVLHRLFTEEETYREAHAKLRANAVAHGIEADARMMCEIHGVNSFRQVQEWRQEQDNLWYERHMNQRIQQGKVGPGGKEDA